MHAALGGLSVAALLAISAPASAGDRDSHAYKACLDTAGPSASMLDCTATEFRRQDAALNTAYGRLMGLMRTVERKRAWRDAQRSWIAFRDAECRAEASEAIGGSLWGVLFGGCKAELTAQRARRLEGLAEAERGK